ncbi:MAG: hypothetical protein IPI41_12130 [Flavobacteriales bacterium]|nr:hypothetical protein [Flavobacteriales bacterium]
MNDQRAAYMADAVTRTSFGHGAMPVATGTGVNGAPSAGTRCKAPLPATTTRLWGASALRNLTTAGSTPRSGSGRCINTGGRNTAVGYQALTGNTNTGRIRR